MKRCFLKILTVLIFNYTFAQFHKNDELRELDTKIDINLDSAAKHMIMFVLTKNLSDYETSMQYLTVADSLNTYFLKLCKAKGIKLDAYQQEGRLDEIKSLKNKKVKDEILADEKNNVVVKFRHKKYEIGPKAKKYFDEFTEFLPAHFK
jgi:hypothetical protein